MDNQLVESSALTSFKIIQIILTTIRDDSIAVLQWSNQVSLWIKLPTTSKYLPTGTCITSTVL